MREAAAVRHFSATAHRSTGSFRKATSFFNLNFEAIRLFDPCIPLPSSEGGEEN